MGYWFCYLILLLPLMTATDITAADITAVKNLKLALVPKEINNPFFIASGEGCKVAAATLPNVECVFRGSS